MSFQQKQEDTDYFSDDSLIFFENEKYVKQHRSAIYSLLISFLMLAALIIIGIYYLFTAAFSIQKEIDKLTTWDFTSHRINAFQNHMIPVDQASRVSSTKLYELLSGFDDSYYDSIEWSLGTNKITPNTFSRQPYISNGYIGSRIPNTGFGFCFDQINLSTNDDNEESLKNGWPLRNKRYAGSFVSDFYSLQKKLNSTNYPELDEKGYTTIISSLPEITNIQLRFNDLSNNNLTYFFNPIDLDHSLIENYSQNMSLKNGLVSTEMDYIDNKIHIKSTLFAHRKEHPLSFMKIEVSLNDPQKRDVFELEVSDILDYETSQRTILKNHGVINENTQHQGIFMAVEPENVPESNAVIFSTCHWNSSSNDAHNKTHFELIEDNNSSISQKTRVILNDSLTSITLYKYTGVLSTEYDNRDMMTASQNLHDVQKMVSDTKFKYGKFLASHINTWKEMYGHTVVEFPSESLLEMVTRSSMFHLLSNTRSEKVSKKRGLPVPVSGLSSDSYGGMVFWDADIWMEPAILPFFPEIAGNMTQYRFAAHEQAIENAKSYGYPGAVYPWTAGRFQNCTSTGPCIDYEYHINIDVTMAAFLLYLQGGDEYGEAYLEKTVWPMVKGAAEFFTEYVKYNKTIGKYETFNMTDPDEFANNINNGAFTNAGIKTLLKWATHIGQHLGKSTDAKWQHISNNISIPKSEAGITLEYSGMNSTVEIKQADVLLMVYPLGYITDETILNTAIRDLYYYSEHQSASGPAMTYPVFVAASAGLLNHGSSSQSYLYKSVTPYLRGPFGQFSEQSNDNYLTNGLTQPAFPFLTAHGGFLQSIVFGLTGIRYAYDLTDDNKIERILKFNPTMLPLIPGGFAIRDFKYQDQALDVIIDNINGTIVNKGDKPIKVLIPDRSVIHDKVTYDQPDILIDNVNSGEEKRSKSKRLHIGIQSKGRYEVIKPRGTFSIPLFQPMLNIDKNIAENKQITNLTAGVSGDVAISVLDGNNYTHWQPANKYEPGKLLIDLGEHNTQEIKGGMVLWGKRPAKNMSISILPTDEKVEQLLKDLSENHVEYQSQEGSRKFSTLLNDTEQCYDFNNDNKCDTEFSALLDWKLDNLNDLIDQFPTVQLLRNKFIKIVDNMLVEPSEKYDSESSDNGQVKLLPSNITEFQVSYNIIDKRSENNNRTPDKTWRKARFVIVSIEGSYDEDDDLRGGTIKELVLYGNDK